MPYFHGALYIDHSKWFYNWVMSKEQVSDNCDYHIPYKAVKAAEIAWNDDAHSAAIFAVLQHRPCEQSRGRMEPQVTVEVAACSSENVTTNNHTSKLKHL